MLYHSYSIYIYGSPKGDMVIKKISDGGKIIISILFFVWSQKVYIPLRNLCLLTQLVMEIIWGGRKTSFNAYVSKCQSFLGEHNSFTREHKICKVSQGNAVLFFERERTQKFSKPMQSFRWKANTTFHRGMQVFCEQVQSLPGKRKAFVNEHREREHKFFWAHAKLQVEQ